MDFSIGVITRQHFARVDLLQHLYEVLCGQNCCVIPLRQQSENVIAALIHISLECDIFIPPCGNKHGHKSAPLIYHYAPSWAAVDQNARRSDARGGAYAVRAGSRPRLQSGLRPNEIKQGGNERFHNDSYP